VKRKVFKIIVGVLAAIGVLGIIAGALIFYFITKVDYKYTGQQLFDAVNEYRANKNLSTVTIDPILCDNLVERYLAIKEPNSGHNGFKEWMAAEGISENPFYLAVAEMYVIDISTPENAIAFWLGSPGHRSTLERPGFNSGCAYANDGTGVIILAEKRL
jgi:hypothetical protein